MTSATTAIHRVAGALAILFAASLFTLPVSCASRPEPVLATHRGVGTVVAINVEKKRIKIDHEKMEGFMEAMVMWFDVRDAALLNGLAAGDRVEFAVVEEEVGYTITEVRKRS